MCVIVEKHTFFYISAKEEVMKLSERMRKIQIWSTKNARPVKETIICWADEVAQLEEENATLKRENEGLKAVNKAGKL